jgi:hypothetical protein
LSAQPVSIVPTEQLGDKYIQPGANTYCALGTPKAWRSLINVSMTNNKIVCKSPVLPLGMLLKFLLSFTDS